MRKVSVTKLFQRETGATLSAAKKMTDQILDGQAVTVEVASRTIAERSCTKATELGLVCTVTKD